MQKWQAKFAKESERECPRARETLVDRRAISSSWYSLNSKAQVLQGSRLEKVREKINYSTICAWKVWCRLWRIWLYSNRRRNWWGLRISQGLWLALWLSRRAAIASKSDSSRSPLSRCDSTLSIRRHSWNTPLGRRPSRSSGPCCYSSTQKPKQRRKKFLLQQQILSHWRHRRPRKLPPKVQKSDKGAGRLSNGDDKQSPERLLKCK